MTGIDRIEDDGRRTPMALVERARIDELEAALAAVVRAMRAWGREEDGIPEDGPIADAYDAAVELLDRSADR